MPLRPLSSGLALLLGATLVGSATAATRVGDYRVLCQIRDDVMIVLVVELGHRREVYR